VVGLDKGFIMYMEVKKMAEIKVTVPKKLKETIGSYGVSNEMLGMFKSGKTVKEIAKLYNLHWQSVKDRLERLTAETGEKINIKMD